MDYKAQKDEYDVIIIGSGISGLVCGCYLAKSNLQVLIIEQHYKPGGYCTSFRRKGYTFDVGVHYLGSCREKEGIIYKILEDHSLLDRINFIRNDPCDRIITPGGITLIRQEHKKTRRELINAFPAEEENINRFFDFILSENFLSITSATKSISFEKLLNSFFNDVNLKMILSIPVGNLGIPPSKVSALISIFLYREYILDGGYYPEGGIQEFPDLLALKFKEYGGELLLSSKVEEIIVRGNIVVGVRLMDGRIIQGKCIVSNSDATATFKELLAHETEEKKKVETLQVSPSAFITYLGVNSDLGKLFDKHFTTWFFPTCDLEKCFDTEKYYNIENYIENEKKFIVDYVICHFPSLVDKQLAPKDCSVIRAMIWFKSHINGDCCEKYKEKIYEKIIDKLDELIPNIRSYIEIKEIAVPNTFHRYTFNRDGSTLGWASTIGQVDKNVFSSQTSLKGLYLTGHWVTNGIGNSGVPLVALCGKNVAGLIERNFRRHRG